MCTMHTVEMRLVAGYAVSRGRGVQAGHQADMQGHWLVTQGSPGPGPTGASERGDVETPAPRRWLALGLAGPRPMRPTWPGAAAPRACHHRPRAGPGQGVHLVGAAAPPRRHHIMMPRPRCGARWQAVATQSPAAGRSGPGPTPGCHYPAASESPVLVDSESPADSFGPSRSGPSTDDPWRPARCDRDGGRGGGRMAIMRERNAHGKGRSRDRDCGDNPLGPPVPPSHSSKASPRMTRLCVITGSSF
jgi:hypothetical protein